MAIEHFSLTAFIIIFGFWLTVDQNNERKSRINQILLPNNNNSTATGMANNKTANLENKKKN